jgi:hypothetical protein
MSTVNIKSGGAARPSDVDLPAQPRGAPANTHTVTDSCGRIIQLRKPNALSRMRLALVAGAEGAENASFMLYANLASSVAKIDDMDCHPPRTMTALEGVVQMLDEDGLGAVMSGWAEAGWLSDAPAAEQQETHTDAVKN